MSNLIHLLRRRSFYQIFIWMLKKLPFALPLRFLRETETLLAFHHPHPAYPFHVIIIPRADLPSLAELDPAHPFLKDLVIVTQDLVREYALSAYRLIVNGGEYQDFPHLHFHLVSGRGQD